VSISTYQVRVVEGRVQVAVGEWDKSVYRS
jgi:hypothetical protein